MLTHEGWWGKYLNTSPNIGFSCSPLLTRGVGWGPVNPGVCMSLERKALGEHPTSQASMLEALA